VLNGSGVTDQAGQTSAALGALGFKMVGTGDSPPVGVQAETVVYFSAKTAADQAAAQLVAKSLSGAVMTALGPTVDGAQVTVVTGSQFTVNAPGAATTSTTGAAAASSTTAPASPSSSTTTTTNPSNAAFQPPTAAVEPLQPWDPRACPAGS
jgi:LytR cell envelope-related transcriptional attenuator